MNSSSSWSFFLGVDVVDRPFLLVHQVGQLDDRLEDRLDGDALEVGGDGPGDLGRDEDIHPAAPAEQLEELAHVELVGVHRDQAVWLELDLLGHVGGRSIRRRSIPRRRVRPLRPRGRPARPAGPVGSPHPAGPGPPPRSADWPGPPRADWPVRRPAAAPRRAEGHPPATDPGRPRSLLGRDPGPGSSIARPSPPDPVGAGRCNGASSATRPGGSSGPHPASSVARSQRGPAPEDSGTWARIVATRTRLIRIPVIPAHAVRCKEMTPRRP